MSIIENIDIIKEKIETHAKKAGHTGKDIALVAVTKTVDIERMREAYDAGLHVFGENRVQEFCDKYEHLKKNVQWHLIGRLQKNKVKYIIGKTALIHSVSSIALADEIEKVSKKQGVVTDCLVQVNIGKEASKSGVAEEELYAFIKQLAGYENLRIKGLMAIAPFLEEPEETRPYFAKMKTLFDNMPISETVEKRWLSMGMSHDYTIAVEEGANMVRIGSSIFGVRD